MHITKIILHSKFTKLGQVSNHHQGDGQNQNSTLGVTLNTRREERPDRNSRSLQRKDRILHSSRRKAHLEVKIVA